VDAAAIKPVAVKKILQQHQFKSNY
jgi:hypothetical protein